MMTALPQTWALLTEEDTWWKGNRLLQLLHRVEKDLGFNRTNPNAVLPPILTGAGHVEGVDDDIAYGPMMLMSKSLLTQLAARLDQCRAVVAHRCLEHQNSVPLALQHPNSANSSNVFVPDYVIEMSAKAPADKILVKCQDNYPPDCSALCARRMDTYDGAIYNNGKCVAYQVSHFFFKLISKHNLCRTHFLLLQTTSSPCAPISCLASKVQSRERCSLMATRFMVTKCV
jgi:hypothetical protein